MHILSRSFSQRRKSSHKRPRDLHIRKVSFSGCSLSSGCSFSSTSSTSTTRTHLADMPNGGSHPAGFDPLSLHPTFQPPPRLHERPYLERRRPGEPASAFWDSEDETELSEVEELKEMTLPPHAITMDHETEKEEAQDYFYKTLSTRPPLPRSHWSVSTIATIDSITPDATTTPTVANPDEEDDDDNISVLEMAALNRRNSNYTFNFSLQHAASTPQRPPMRPMDSIDNFMKRGGWKRRGIVFNEDDVGSKPQRTSYIN